MVFLATTLVYPALAIDPHWLVSQYVRDKWGREQGFPLSQVRAITQTPDGYLWIGTESGLVRFDGLNFRVIQDDTRTFDVRRVLGLDVDSDGSLWIRLDGPEERTLLRYRNGSFDNPLADRLPWPNARITTTTNSTEGVLLGFQTQRGVIAYRGGKFELLASAAGLPRSPVLSLAQTSDGDLWMGTRDAGLFRSANRISSAITKGVPDPKINCLLANSNELWAGTDDGVVRWTGTAFTSAGIPESLNHFQAISMTRDRDGNIWIGTVSKGLLRLNAQGLTSLNPVGGDRNEAITAVFEDREGDIWTGSASGIQRLRDSAFVTYSTAEGMPSPSNGPIYVDERNRTWFAPLNGGLYWLENGSVNRFTATGVGNEVVYSITGGPGELWLGRRHGGLTHIRFAGKTTKVETLSTKAGLAQDTVIAVQLDRDGALWAGTLNGGVSRYRNGAFTSYTTRNGLVSNTVVSISQTANGAMWFSTPKGLSVFSNGNWRSYSVQHGLPSPNINCVFQDSTGAVWVGTAAGLTLFRSGLFQDRWGAVDALREQILGIAEDHHGYLWIATANHILRVNRDKLVAARPGAADVRLYGLVDGLQGTESIRRHRSVAADPSGRIWFSLNIGLSVIDPSREFRGTAPVLAQIQSISADGRDLNIAGPVRVPPRSQRIAIQYTGLGLSVPDTIRFRTALDPDNSQWSDPVSDRSRDYTYLKPGKYKFRVIASRLDGDWKNSPEAAISFDVEPAFWQTLWFQLGVLLACGSITVAAYRYRLHQLASQLNVRFEERLAERSSIARELHDTLLQGLLSASMQLNVATDALPEDSPARPRLQRVLDLMTQVVEEGRNAIRGLRSSSNTSFALEQAFSRIQDELALPDKMDFRVIVTGKPRPLHPLLRDESYRIGREGLIHAFRHSRATAVEAEVAYSSRQLRIVISDNGAGIEPQEMQGLSAIQERAGKIGGQLHVRTSPTAGTELEFSVPSHIAYRGQPSKRRWWHF